MTPANILAINGILPRRGIVSSAMAMILIWMTASGLMMASCGETEIQRSGAYPKSLDISNTDDMSVAISDSGDSTLLVGRSKADKSVLNVYRGANKINLQGIQYYQQLEDEDESVIENISGRDLLGQTFNIEELAEGLNITFKLSRPGSSGQLYADLYTGSVGPLPEQLFDDSSYIDLQETGATSKGAECAQSFATLRGCDSLKLTFKMRQGTAPPDGNYFFSLYRGLFPEWELVETLPLYPSAGLNATTFTEYSYTFSDTGDYGAGVYSVTIERDTLGGSIWVASSHTDGAATGHNLHSALYFFEYGVQDPTTSYTWNGNMALYFKAEPGSGDDWGESPQFIETSGAYVDNTSGEYLSTTPKNILFDFTSNLDSGIYSVVLRRESGFGEYTVHGKEYSITNRKTQVFTQLSHFVDSVTSISNTQNIYSSGYVLKHIGLKSSGEISKMYQTFTPLQESSGLVVRFDDARSSIQTYDDYLVVSLYGGVPNAASTLLEEVNVDRKDIEGIYGFQVRFYSHIDPSNNYYFTLSSSNPKTSGYIYDIAYWDGADYTGGYYAQDTWQGAPLTSTWDGTVNKDLGINILFTRSINISSKRYDSELTMVRGNYYNDIFIPYLDISAPIDFPSAYTTYSLMSTITPSEVLFPQSFYLFDIFYGTGGYWRLFVYPQSYGTCYIYTSTDSGSTWTSYSLIPSTHQTNIISSRYFYDSRGNIYYYYKTGQGKDYVTMTSNAGFYWSVPKSLNDDGYIFSSKVRPSFTEDDNDVIWLIGISNNDQLISRRLVAGAL